MSTTWEQLEGAAVSLARAGPIKDRLAEAFRSHLAEVNTDELPESLRQQFRVCHDALIRERPQPGEDAVRATVRKLSGSEADELACFVVRLYGAYVRETTREATLHRRLPTKKGSDLRDVNIWTMFASELASSPCLQYEYVAYDALGRQL
jgi:hypothetical protein